MDVDLGFETVSQLFLSRAMKHAEEDRFRAFIDNQWRAIKWKEYHHTAREIGLGLRALGVEPGDRVCILSQSRVEWAYCDVGIFCLGAIPVPIYATLPAEQAAYIAEHSQAGVVFVEDEEQAAKIRSQRGKLPALRTVVVIAGAGGSTTGDGRQDPYRGSGGDEVSLDELRQRGRAYHKDHPDEFEEMARAVKPDDTFTIIYTSGTTGRPKGVVTTHANYVTMIRMINEPLPLEPDDENLLFLPLAHAFARLEHLATMAVPLRTSFARSLETVVEDLQAVRPTLLFSVPRIYEKAYAKIMAKVEAGSPLKRTLFRWSVNVGTKVSRLKQERRPIPPILALQYGLAQRLVFKKILGILGGRLRFAATGAASISREILEFFHACGVLILEGYGMTETSTVSHINPFDSYQFGTVGPPLPGVEQRIATDGEVLLRGPNIMQGYYKMPKESAETLKDGWLHTGDIGVVNDKGYLRITDRKKSLFKTSGGKYIAPTPIEDAMKADPRISQVLVYGAARRFCVALVTLNKEEVLAPGNGGSRGWSEVVKSDEIRQMVQGVVDGVNARLASYETIKRFVILDKDFSIDGGELTPTLKVKRRVVEGRYADLLDGLYGD